MTNEDYRPTLAVRPASHSIELGDKVGAKISEYASGLAIDDVGIISIEQNSRSWYITMKEIPQPYSLGSSGSRVESMPGEPRNSDYVHFNLSLRGVEWSKTVEIFVYTNVRN